MITGSKVKWTSQAGGIAKEKTGTIVAVIDPMQTPNMSELVKEHNAISEYGGGMWRNHVSYVIKVPGKTSRGKPHLYWPVASLLQEVISPKEVQS